MATKAEKAKEKIAEAVFKARRRWIEKLFPSGVYHSDGTLTLSRYIADQLREKIRQEYIDQTSKIVTEMETEADRIIEAIDGKEDITEVK